MMGVTCHVVELNQSGLFLVKGMNFKVVLMKDDVIGAIMAEDIRVNIFSKSLSVYIP